MDGFLAGSADAEVKGIVTTFLASRSVLERAAELGANLVITHEGIYYSHQADTGHLEDDSVFRAKKKWIEDTGLVIYRNHDHVHACDPDEITEGLVEALGWQDKVALARPEASIIRIPEVSLRDLVSFLKTRLRLPHVRMVGDLSMPCSRVGLFVGYRGGGRTVIPLFEKMDLDVVIAGEGPEWETPEYVRDAMHQGQRKALVLIGHAASEEPGMERLAARIRRAFPEVPVHFLSDPPVLQIL